MSGPTQEQIEAALRTGGAPYTYKTYKGVPSGDGVRRMARIVYLRTSGERPVPYQVIGEEVGLSRERVRVLYARALRHLRRPHRRQLVNAVVTHGDGLSRELFGCYDGDGCRT